MPGLPAFSGGWVTEVKAKHSTNTDSGDMQNAVQPRALDPRAGWARFWGVSTVTLNLRRVTARHYVKHYHAVLHSTTGNRLGKHIQLRMA